VSRRSRSSISSFRSLTNIPLFQFCFALDSQRTQLRVSGACSPRYRFSRRPRPCAAECRRYPKPSSRQSHSRAVLQSPLFSLESPPSQSLDRLTRLLGSVTTAFRSLTLFCISPIPQTYPHTNYDDLFLVSVISAQSGIPRFDGYFPKSFFTGGCSYRVSALGVKPFFHTLIPHAG